MSFPRYPKYKASGVEWLGEVPAHWEVQRLKNSVASSKNGTWGEDANGGEDDVVCVRVADFDRSKLRTDISNPTLRNVSAKDRNGRLLAPGDLLLEKSGGGETSPVGFVALWDHCVPAVCSNFVSRLVLAEGMSSRYWCYAHSAAYCVGINTRSIKQTSGIQNLDSQQYLDEPIAFPPLPEQRAIAAFLDRETAKIDALIAEQEKLIALLAEKRQAVISHAVTKGLNPNAPMKPSGVEWLGEVPAHWEVVPVASIATLVNGYPFDSELFDSTEGTPLVRIRDLGRDTTEARFRGQPIGAAQITKADVLIGMDGDFNVGRWHGHGTALLNQRMCCVRASNALLTRLLEYALPTPLRLINAVTYATTVKHLASSQVGKTRVAVPTQSELGSIIKFLDRETARFDALTKEADSAITLLRERRAALISAAVTGQIDVRHLAPESAA